MIYTEEYNDDDDADDYNPVVAEVAPGTGRHPFPLGAAGSGDWIIETWEIQSRK